VLVKFDTSDKLLELENAKSSLKSSQQQVEQAAANYNTVQKDYERNNSLFADGLVSRQNLDDATNKLQAALTSLQNSRENVSQANTQIQMITNALEDFQITASISGVVESKSYNLKKLKKACKCRYISAPWGIWNTPVRLK
jgi:multidrug resistance efflux pump